MEIIRNVTEIGSADREALEHLLGLPLHDHQRVVLRVYDVDENTTLSETSDASADDSTTLPAWCNVFEGLSDDEIAQVEAIMRTRADLTRTSD